MRVLLVHGMGRTPLSLRGLASDLRRAGHEPAIVGYAAWAESFENIVRRVAARLAVWERAAIPYAGIGHSLGGLVLRAALGSQPAHFARHVVLLGTPNRPSQLAARVGRHLWYRACNGACGQHLADPGFFEGLPRLSLPCTIVAGTRSNRFTRGFFRNTPNDGIVAVAETQLPSARHVALPVGHTFMMNDVRVRAEIRAALAGAAPEAT